MFAGMSVATVDIAPFTTMAERNQLYGLNVVGLRRRKVSRGSIAALKDCYRIVLRESSSVKESAAELLAGEYGEIDETKAFLKFFQGGTRGFAKSVSTKQ